MSKPRPPRNRTQAPQKRSGVIREAWDNMSEDINRMLPEKLRTRGKKKFVLWLFVLELLVLGIVGKFLYDWLVG